MNLNILSNPQTILGWDGSLGLFRILKERNVKKVLLVIDPILVNLTDFKNLLNQIEEEVSELNIYTDVTPEPSVETAQELVEYAREEEYCIVLGIGGGSALDLAKLAAVFFNNSGNVKEYLGLTGTRKIENKGIFKILIPTTAGTGSEVTDISVLALSDTKDVISHPFLKADLAIVDPKLTLTVPSKVTAATGADALTHAIEAYLSVNANAYSDTLALESIRLILGNLEQAVKDSSNAKARTGMAYGSYFAALAFSNAGVGAVHALAYPLGGEFKIAHGDSNAVMLPYVLDFIKSECSERLSIILTQFEKIGAIDKVEGNHLQRANECVKELNNLCKQIGIPSTLKDFNIPESALKKLANQGIKQKRLLARCPIDLSEENILQIYQKAYQGA